MKDIVKQEIINIENSVFIYKGQPVLLDCDVASFYGVETKNINQAVSRNPEKFPDGYVLTISPFEVNSLRCQIGTLKKSKYQIATLSKNSEKQVVLESGTGKHTKYSANIFTERGLYMLATILKSERATKVTLKIIDTFTKFRSITNNLNSANNSKTEIEKGEFLKKSGTALVDLLSDNLRDNDDENIESVKTTIKLDLGIFKIEKSIEKKKKKEHL